MARTEAGPAPGFVGSAACHPAKRRPSSALEKYTCVGLGLGLGVGLGQG